MSGPNGNANVELMVAAIIIIAISLVINLSCWLVASRSTEMAEASFGKKSHQLNNLAAIFEYKVSARSL